MRAPSALIFAALIAATAVAGAQSQRGLPVQERRRSGQRDRDRTGRDGRFVSGLRQEDFTVYEDGKLQDVSHFSNDRVPVSLGIVLDTSGSMSPDKMAAARSAIDRMIFDLLDQQDELFLVQFATRATLKQDWTTDRGLISRAVRDATATGGTAIYDAVSPGYSDGAGGQHRKKALLIISDGNDTNSSIPVASCASRFARAKCSSTPSVSTAPARRAADVVRPPVQIPMPMPFPFPGGRRPGPAPPPIPRVAAVVEAVDGQPATA